MLMLSNKVLYANVNVKGYELGILQFFVTLVALYVTPKNPELDKGITIFTIAISWYGTLATALLKKLQT